MPADEIPISTWLRWQQNSIPQSDYFLSLNKEKIVVQKVL